MSLLDLFEEIGFPTNSCNTNLHSGPDPHFGCRQSSRAYQARKRREMQDKMDRKRARARQQHENQSETSAKDLCQEKKLAGGFFRTQTTSTAPNRHTRKSSSEEEFFFDADSPRQTGKEHGLVERKSSSEEEFFFDADSARQTGKEHGLAERKSSSEEELLFDADSPTQTSKEHVLAVTSLLSLSRDPNGKSICSASSGCMSGPLACNESFSGEDSAPYHIGAEPLMETRKDTPRPPLPKLTQVEWNRISAPSLNDTPRSTLSKAGWDPIGVPQQRRKRQMILLDRGVEDTGTNKRGRARRTLRL